MTQKSKSCLTLPKGVKVDSFRESGDDVSDGALADCAFVSVALDLFLFLIRLVFLRVSVI